MEHPTAGLLTLAANIVSAHVEHNEVSHNEVPRLIREVYETLVDVGKGHAHPPVAHATAATPAARRAKAGGSAEILTCLECGMKMKMLKRHLLTVHGMTPDAEAQPAGRCADGHVELCRTALATREGERPGQAAVGAWPGLTEGTGYGVSNRRDRVVPTASTALVQSPGRG